MVRRQEIVNCKFHDPPSREGNFGVKKCKIDVFLKQEICGNRIKAGFFKVIIQDLAVHGTNV